MGTRKYPGGCRWFDSIYAYHGRGQGNLAPATKDISYCPNRVSSVTQALEGLVVSGEVRSAREGHSLLGGAIPSVSTKPVRYGIAKPGIAVKRLLRFTVLGRRLGSIPSTGTKQMKLNGRAEASNTFGCGFESRHLHHENQTC